MFATSMEWIIFVITLIILILLVTLMVNSYRISNRLEKAQTTVLAAADRLEKAETTVIATSKNLDAVATNVNSFLSEAKPFFNYAENFICKNIKPKPSFCP